MEMRARKCARDKIVYVAYVEAPLKFDRITETCKLGMTPE